MKLVYSPLNVSFLKTIVTKLPFSGNIFASRKERDSFISVSIENFMFLCFIYMFKKKLRMFRFIKQNKNIIHISFVINKQV